MSPSIDESPRDATGRDPVGAVLFEIEMVLVDTMEPRRRALRSALGDDIYRDDDEIAAACAWQSTRDAVAELMRTRAPGADDTEVELAALRTERALEAELSRSPLALAPGASELVRDLAGRTRLAIATRASQREAAAMLARWDAAMLFECVVTRDDVALSKPAPDTHRLALRRLSARSAPRGRVIAVEDAGLGHQAALAAGLEATSIEVFGSEARNVGAIIQ